MSSQPTSGPTPTPHTTRERAHRDTVLGSVAAYTDHAAAYTDDNADLVESHAHAFAAALPARSRILDAGCGPGRDLARFAAAGHDPIGVDLNPTFVTLARRHGPAVLGDLRRLPLTDDSVDAVWACASLVHLDPVQAGQALRELRRVARPGAPLHLSVKHEGTTGWVDSPHGRRWFHIWTRDELHTALAAAGLAHIEIRPDGRFLLATATC